MSTEITSPAAQPDDGSASGGRTNIETRSIDWITPEERHGTPWKVSPLFFIANWSFFTIALGFTGPSLGLSVGWAILGSALGLLVGTFFMAFHATQGPRLGLPQIIQSRAQFGFYGVIVVVAMSLTCYLAFGVVYTILTAQGLAQIFGWSPVVIGLVVNIAGGLFAIAGHDALHRVSRLVFYVTVPLVVIFTVAVLTGHAGGSTPPADSHGFVASAFFSVFAVSAAYNIALAPVVSDYTRYLPARTSSRSLIASVYVGAGVSALWLIALGAWLSAHYNASDALVALHDAGNSVFGGFGAVLALASAATLVVCTATAAYSVTLQFLTGVDLVKRVKPTRTLRVSVTAATIAIYLVVAIPFGDHVINAASNALSLMLFLLVPWTAVNLTDYFFIRRGEYAITDLFTPRGVYGGWSWRGIVAYFLGFAAMVPFAVLPFFTGPIGNWLGGIDISWLAGLLVASLTYFAFTRGLDRRAERAAVSESDEQLDDVTQAPSEVGHRPPLEYGLLEGKG
ncbi:purine-cytosine permease family protein [Mycolicibacterium komossense]|uniref:Cytosine permease n=1 Tax=Mycolicibacterium komossense TaxID=1779 RepID=A0ABT3C7V0_9MYCO|nr:cytosine permease [Mycolicibacterium komossense]MCV7225533.1 cytosine permease [Mycolicibacterium komossense]